MDQSLWDKSSIIYIYIYIHVYMYVYDTYTLRRTCFGFQKSTWLPTVAPLLGFKFPTMNVCNYQKRACNALYTCLSMHTSMVDQIPEHMHTYTLFRRVYLFEKKPACIWSFWKFARKIQEKNHKTCLKIAQSTWGKNHEMWDKFAQYIWGTIGTHRCFCL